jgi:hypothetical protein
MEHRLVISYDKRDLDILFDAQGEFVVSVMPMVTGETLAEAEKRETLLVTASARFDGTSWYLANLDKEIRTRIKAYNTKARQDGKGEVDIRKVEQLAVSLLPPDDVEDMKYFTFKDRMVPIAGGQKCGGRK